MTFSSALNAYCAMLGCSNKELAERCGVSMSALSRYRNGKRVPRLNSDAVGKLANGIAALACERGIRSMSSEAAIEVALNAAIAEGLPLGPSFSDRVDAIMTLVKMRNSDLAKTLGLDSSYISRIRRGEREPNDKRRFVEVISQAAVVKGMKDGLISDILDLIGAGEALATWRPLDVDSLAGIRQMICRWVLGDQVNDSDLALLDGLFSDLDAGYYEDVLSSPRDAALPAACPADCAPSAQFFAGEGFMWQAENRFLESAAACGAQHVYLSSDMPALEIDLIPEMREHYQRSILQLIDRGCEVTVIHSVDRPLRDSIVTMRMWIPLYMTGKVTSLYLQGTSSRLFCHVNNVCECCAMASEAVRGREEHGRYYLSSLPDDLAYYQRKMGFMLEEASVLLEVYRADDPTSLAEFERGEAVRQARGNGREVQAGRYRNLRLFLYAGDCAVVYLERDPRMRFVIRHPKLRYVISQML